MPVPKSPETLSWLQLLQWYVDAGVDETISERPIDRYALTKPQPAQSRIGPGVQESTGTAARSSISPPPAPRPIEQPPSSTTALPETSSQLAMACQSLAELKEAMEAYEGCALKRTCQRTVFADGNPRARVMLIGEAPGADEDRLGLPFVGTSGKLLDRMLASIGLDRDSTYITNVVPWRPPGNRKPEPTEVELCLPFIERHIELVDPALLILLGGAAATALLARQEAISRLRGRWLPYSSARLGHPIPAMPTYHPAYLLRTPHHKREAWRDLLAVRKSLDSLS